MSERDPDIDDDPREQGTGQGGYPEEDPAGSGGGEAAYEPSDDAPDTEGGQDEDAGGATGNPDAAGA